MKLRRVTFREACDFVEKHHRHHRKPQGHVVSIGCDIDGELVGVAMVGRPVARMLDDGETAEVIRVCADPARADHHVCSWLLSRAKRAAQSIGYRRVVTYTLASEDGASLRAAGWSESGIESKGGRWSRPSRRRDAEANTGPKKRWESA